MNDDSIMPSGKFKGRRLEDVPAWHLLWLWDNNFGTKELRDYIKDNLEVLKKEMKK